MNQEIDNRKMTVVVQHKTPYVVQGRGSFILSYALGHDVSLRCVLGLPTLLSIVMAIYLLSDELFLYGTQSKLFTYFKSTG